MGFSLQLSNFVWLMSSIDRIGKDRHGRGSKQEEENKKRIWFSSYRPLYGHHRRHLLRADPMFFCKSLHILALDLGDMRRDPFESTLSQTKRLIRLSPRP